METGGRTDTTDCSTSRTNAVAKLKSKDTDMLCSIGKQSGEFVESVLKKKRKGLRWKRFAEKEGFKPG